MDAIFIHPAPTSEVGGIQADRGYLDEYFCLVQSRRLAVPCDEGFLRSQRISLGMEKRIMPSYPVTAMVPWLGG